MVKQLLMYQQVAPVSKSKHLNLHIKPGNDYSFAQDLNSVPLTLIEFPAAASEYAIVFVTADDQVMPAVIMGMKDQENRYCDETGHWKANYVPAFIRRYPFVFSSNADNNQLTLCVDESFAGCNLEGKGERLFDVEGEQSLYLKNVLAFLEEYQLHFQRTKAFCKRLVELDLLQPLSAKLATKDAGIETIAGFQGIDRAKLKALPADTLAGLAGNDWLELIYIHLHSVRNFGLAMDRVSKAKVAPAAA